jgi:hypothetical protein
MGGGGGSDSVQGHAEKGGGGAWAREAVGDLGRHGTDAALRAAPTSVGGACDAGAEGSGPRTKEGDTCVTRCGRD